MPWIDLADVKAHLNKKTASDDEELGGFIDAACAMVEDIIGHVDPVQKSYTEPAVPRPQQSAPWRYSRWQRQIELPETPILSVQSVTWLTGDGVTSTVVAEQDYATGTAGWSRVGNVVQLPTSSTYGITLPIGEGVASPYAGAWVVAYTAGLNPVPDNVRMAALELVAHLWRSTQNANGSPGRLGETDTDWQRGMGYAMPFRVRELLGMYGNSVPSRGFVIA